MLAIMAAISAIGVICSRRAHEPSANPPHLFGTFAIAGRAGIVGEDDVGERPPTVIPRSIDRQDACP